MVGLCIEQVECPMLPTTSMSMVSSSRLCVHSICDHYASLASKSFCRTFFNENSFAKKEKSHDQQGPKRLSKLFFHGACKFSSSWPLWRYIDFNTKLFTLHTSTRQTLRSFDKKMCQAPLLWCREHNKIKNQNHQQGPTRLAKKIILNFFFTWTCSSWVYSATRKHEESATLWQVAQSSPLTKTKLWDVLYSIISDVIIIAGKPSPIYHFIIKMNKES